MWNGQQAAAAPEENYAIIQRRSTTLNANRVTINGMYDPAYTTCAAITNWIGETGPNYRAGAGGGGHPMKKRKIVPPLVDPTRYHALGLRRPVRLDCTFNGNPYSIFTWHAPQGGGTGGPNFSGRDARRGYSLWQDWGGGSAYHAARTVLAGDLNARSAGVLGLGEAWAQAVNPRANIHNDAVTHSYWSGVVLNEVVRNRIDNLAQYSDHVALGAEVQ